MATLFGPSRPPFANTPVSGPRGSDGKADLVIATVALLLLLVTLAIARPEPMPQRVFAPAEPRFFSVVRGGVEIATYDPKDNRLIVSDHAPRALLICVRGRCDLAEGWIGK